MLARFQRGLEALYRVATEVEVEDFVIDAESRARLGVARAPREQLLVAHRDGEVELGLFVDEHALANLERHDPAEVLDDRNFDDFLLTLEGVSHFVYVVLGARSERRVSALELELQAEVDKYISTLLTLDRHGAAEFADLPRRLYDVELADDLDDEERDRYRTAYRSARRYAESLHERYVRRRRIDQLLAELRRFYRLPLDAKLALTRA